MPLELPPELIVAVMIGVALTLYTVLGGADFGAGVWEFNTALQSAPADRALVYRAIGPVWEANHVWLIFVLMLLANGFPIVLAAISRALWVPLLLALVGIVFRGAAYAFRAHDKSPSGTHDAWGAVFAAASTAAPFFLGASFGAIFSQRLDISSKGEYDGNHFLQWLSSLSIFTAFYAVGVCSYLAATYMTREAQREGSTELAEIWRRRAMANGLWMGILSLAGLALIAAEAPELARGFQERSWPLVVVSLLSGFFSLLALGRRRYGWAVAGVVTTISTVLWSAFIAQYPVLVPPAITVADHAPPNVLWVMIVGSAIGASLLIPSLAYLLVLFKSRPQ